jgi:hypothetical protein
MGDGFLFFNDIYRPDFPGETFHVLKEKEEKEYGEYRARRFVLEALKRFSRPTVKVHIKNRDLYFRSKKYNFALQNCKLTSDPFSSVLMTSANYCGCRRIHQRGPNWITQKMIVIDFYLWNMTF